MASPARETDGAGRQWNAEKDVRNVRDFSVKRLPSGGTRSCMPQQTWYAAVCADWEQKLCVFWSRPNPHRDRPRHCQWASSLVQRLWLARFVQASTLFGIGLKSTPRWRYGAVRLAPMQWRCGSNSTTAFGVYNGVCRLGDCWMTPGWPNFMHCCFPQYKTSRLDYAGVNVKPPLPTMGRGGKYHRLPGNLHICVPDLNPRGGRFCGFGDSNVKESPHLSAQ